ncbi:MAG: 3-hydroxybutyrate dehydrogenase [Hyphomicrobiaceae bacterium]
MTDKDLSGGTLQDKVALVTGSTSGIGLGIATAFAANGAHVVINGLGTEEENATAISSVREFGNKVAFNPANMLRHNQIAAMIEDAEAMFGRVDILVNNAGIQHVSPIEEFPTEKWDAVLAINLSSAFHTMKAVIPGMKARKWGRLINICSAHSLRASPNKAAYVAAKHGLAGLTKVVALELAKSGVTCNAISPGFVWTPLVEKQVPDVAAAQGLTEEEAKAWILARQPSGEFATVDQIGALATFLSGDTAGAITGANYSIDGGWTAQ